MGVTTEPPWLHKTVGVAAGNGTNAHTITFSTFGDAPFTPADGSLLAVFVFGAVTHTVSAGGWTEQAEPVNSGEMSLFTVTASSTTSITITHNGSNYPIGVAVYEFAAGSTFLAAIGAAGAGTDVFPALSGLAAVEKVVIGARGRTEVNGTSGASTVWTNSYVQDASLYQATAGGAEGFYMTVGHKINDTATSVTPTATTTYTGTWPTTDRQRVTSAFNVVMAGGGPTPFTKDWSDTWRITNAITKDYTTTWRVTNALTKDWSSTWRVTNAFTKDWSTDWRVSTAFNKDYADAWRVTNSITKDYVSSWNILAAWQKDYASTWRITNAIAKEWSESWRVFNAFSKDWASTWDLLAGTGWTKDYADTWRVRNAWSADWISTWRVLNTWQGDWSGTWRVRNGWAKDYESTWDLFQGEAFTKDWADSWRIRALFQRDWASTWNIDSDILPPPLSADVTARIGVRTTARIITPTVTARL